MRRRAIVVGLFCIAACRSSPPPRHVSRGCRPRVVDLEPTCGVMPSAEDRVKTLWLDGPETGGDQMQGDVCMGLLLVVEYESGAVCRQRIASSASIGILGADGVYVDDRLVCLHVEGAALEVRRDDAIVASVPKPRDIEKALANGRTFPARCVD